MRGVIQAVGYLAGILVVGALLLDEGQVVTLLTEEDGREYETHLWIVDLGDQLYIRANRPDAEWLERINADPDVGLRWSDGIGEEVFSFRARRVKDPSIRDKVSRGLAQKHGFADRVRTFLAEDKSTVVFELIPADASTISEPVSNDLGLIH